MQRIGAVAPGAEAGVRAAVASVFAQHGAEPGGALALSGAHVLSLKDRSGEPAAATLRGAGLISVVYGILLLVGAASGSRDPLQPLDRLGAGASRTSAVAEHGLAFQRIKTVDDLERALASAQYHPL